jgi:hypothetical protein
LKFTHAEYNSPIVYTDAGTARFFNHVFETDDKKMIAALKKEKGVTAGEPDEPVNENA